VAFRCSADPRMMIFDRPSQVFLKLPLTQREKTA
jgi:hypothetical protein